MQSKGAIKLVAALVAVACIWQLSFTAVTKIQEKKASKYADAAVAAFQQTPAWSKVAAEDQAYVLDSLAKDRNRWYTDSVSAEKVYFGYTYKDVKSKEINLGLDLKGGMNVMLQVQLSDLVKALAGENRTPEFEKALALAQERSVNSRQDFISLFAEAWTEVSNGQRLAQVFGTYEMRDRIKPESTDDEVISVIREDAESAVSNSFNVLRNRIDRFGVTQPSIQKIGNSGRILVELPGVKEPERVRKLLQGTASLEFWTTFDNSEVSQYLVEADALLAELLAQDETAEEVAEPQVEEQMSDLLSEELQSNSEEDLAIEEYRKSHPLFAVLQPSGARGNACIGFAQGGDTAIVNRYLNNERVKELFPAEFRAMWSVNPSEYAGGSNIYELVAIKAASRDGKAPLDGSAVTDARVSYEGQGMNQGSPVVSMTMNAEGANKWARITKDNIGKQVAIVLDGLVYSYPTVQTCALPICRPKSPAEAHRFQVTSP